MIDFSFEVISDTNINIEYLYGDEKFIFNIYLKHDCWTIHPFNGILLQNRELCKIVLIELFKNKNFQIMLAKENILLSSLGTSIDLDHPETTDRSDSVNDRTDRLSEHQDYIDSNSITDILQQEVQMIDKKIVIFNKLLEKMFMGNYGPGDYEFDKIQSLVHIYKDVQEKMDSLSDNDSRRNNKRRY
jgi:hypothetical protein